VTSDLIRITYRDVFDNEIGEVNLSTRVQITPVGMIALGATGNRASRTTTTERLHLVDWFHLSQSTRLAFSESRFFFQFSARQIKHNGRLRGISIDPTGRLDENLNVVFPKSKRLSKLYRPAPLFFF
jgi:hypothetical protein